MQFKVCSKCGIKKDVLQFNPRKDSIDGFRNECKKCRKVYDKRYREKLGEELPKRKHRYYINNKIVLCQKQKKYREKNKDKIAERQKQYCQKNKDKIREYHYNYYKQKTEWFNDYKKTLQCEICGEKFFPLLIFHHVNPDEKENTISSLVSRHYSRKKVLKEIKKCQVLCSNCHLLTHWEERQIYKEDYLENPYLQGGI